MPFPALPATPVAQQATPDQQGDSWAWTNLLIRLAEFLTGSVIMYVGVNSLLKSVKGTV